MMSLFFKTVTCASVYSLIFACFSGCATKQLIHRDVQVQVLSANDEQPIQGAEVEIQFEGGTQNMNNPFYPFAAIFSGPILTPETLKTDRNGFVNLEPLIYDRDPYTPEGRFLSSRRGEKEINRIIVRANGFSAFDSDRRVKFEQNREGVWVNISNNPQFWSDFPKLEVVLEPLSYEER